MRENTKAQDAPSNIELSDAYTQLAIQGPRAAQVLQKLTENGLAPIKNYWFTWGKVCGLPNTLIARTGYTGEDGFEIYVPSDEATSERVWNEVLEAGKEFGIMPCGLGARNTLRLESAMALYGHEISDDINVFEAGLDRYASSTKAISSAATRCSSMQRAAQPRAGRPGNDRPRHRSRRIRRPRTRASRSATSPVGSPSPFLKKNIALAPASRYDRARPKLQSKSAAAGQSGGRRRHRSTGARKSGKAATNVLKNHESRED